MVLFLVAFYPPRNTDAHGKNLPLQEPLFTIPWVLNLIVEAYVAAKRIEAGRARSWSTASRGGEPGTLPRMPGGLGGWTVIPTCGPCFLRVLWVVMEQKGNKRGTVRSKFLEPLCCDVRPLAEGWPFEPEVK